MFPSQNIDMGVAQQIDEMASYAFTYEDYSRKNLAELWFGITICSVGRDCLRHYEIAAAAAIPCFCNLLEKPLHSAPHALKKGDNSIVYVNVDQLLKYLHALTPNQESAMHLKALQWAKDNSTRERALKILDRAGLRPKT